MIHRIKECIHCGVQYSYQASGHCYYREENDEHYCRECKRAINEALAKIPVKFDYRFVSTNEISKEQMLGFIKEKELKLIKQQEEGAKDNNLFTGLMVRRVYPSLHNLQTGESSHEESAEYNGTEYYMSWWDSRPDDYKIRKKVRWDILNNCIANK